MKSLAIDEFNCLYSDSHCPVSVSLNIRCPTRDKSIRVNTKNNANEQTRLWNDEKKNVFIENIDHEIVQEISSYLTYLSIYKDEINEQNINVVCKIENVFKNACKTSFGVKKPSKFQASSNKK